MVLYQEFSWKSFIFRFNTHLYFKQIDSIDSSRAFYSCYDDLMLRSRRRRRQGPITISSISLTLHPPPRRTFSHRR